MDSAMTFQTPDAIRQRLHEVEELQRAHDARDMDAELLEVISKGGDVDALETAQMEAERASRRLRVERQALEAALPIAEKRAGLHQISGLAEDFDRLGEVAKSAVDDLGRTWEAFSNAVSAWEEIQARAVSLTAEVSRIAEATKAQAPDLGNFRSAKVISIARSTVTLLDRLALAERETRSGIRGVQSRVLD